MINTVNAPVSGAASQAAGRNILITYASRQGSTAGVAEAIGKTLRRAGNSVEAKWVGDVTDLSMYDAVVIGSAIQYDRWLPEATAFLQDNQTRLSQMPVAYFFTCLTLAKRNEKTERQAMNYAQKIEALSSWVKPVTIGRFAGSLTYQKIAFPLRLILRTMMLFTGVQEGDYRDWQAIQAWAEAFHLQLMNIPTKQEKI